MLLVPRRGGGFRWTIGYPTLVGLVEPVFRGLEEMEGEWPPGPVLLNFWRRPVIFAVTVVPVRRSSFGVHGFDGSGQRPLGDAGDLTRPIGSAVLW